MDIALKPARTKVETHHITSHLFTSNSIPRATILAFLPRNCPIRIGVKGINRKGVLELKQSRAVLGMA
ncbi:hypothetical protein PRUPE_4G232300 [Prunus persica]|uniref:Uncharacterized protein n=1 Tax=Prunus persica TaxID=3760 RepID=A0A251PPT5_PRUPE|nr:hypothetical protein PRUPE_4G232300 [Prunus persica]